MVEEEGNKNEEYWRHEERMSGGYVLPYMHHAYHNNSAIVIFYSFIVSYKIILVHFPPLPLRSSPIRFLAPPRRTIRRREKKKRKEDWDGDWWR